MQRPFLVAFGLIVSVAFMAIVAVSGWLGAAVGDAIGRFYGSRYVLMPLSGPARPDVAGALTGLIVGFVLGTLWCGATLTLIAIANNTRRTKELLAGRL
jgi:hypothetical protein